MRQVQRFFVFCTFLRGLWLASTELALLTAIWGEATTPGQRHATVQPCTKHHKSPPQNKLGPQIS